MPHSRLNALLQRLPAGNLSRRNRLVIYYLVGLVIVVSTYAVLYNIAISRLEGVDQSIFRSLEFVMQTMTTTGYGQDAASWSHPLMFLFVSFTQVSGIGIAFFTLRLIVIPLFTSAEVDLDDRLTPKSDHVVICEYSRDSAVLLEELQELDIEYVLISSAKQKAKRLSDEGYSVIHGSPQSADALERASVDTARAVITDAGTANVNTILTVESIRPAVEIITLTDDSGMREILLETGADTVLSPHGLLGRRLAEKAVSSFSSEVTDAIELGPDLEMMEVSVHERSRLAGTPIRDSNLREEKGANIIGAWIDGELQMPPDPETTIRPNTMLLVVGNREDLQTLSKYTRPLRSLLSHDRIVIAGRGEVGQAAQRAVADEGVATTTIDREPHDAVDVVGPAESEDVLQEAEIETAGAIVIGFPDDSAALLTTVLARSLNPNIEILARVNDTDATTKALSAGADYVLSVPHVSARMVARELRDEDLLTPASQIRLIRVPAEPLAGSTLAQSEIFEQTGCRVIAMEDDAGRTGEIDPTYQFSGDERITLVGLDEAVQSFLLEYDGSPLEA